MLLSSGYGRRPCYFKVLGESDNVEMTRLGAVEVLGTIPGRNPKPGQSASLPSV